MTAPSFPTLRVRPVREMSLHDIEMVRKILRGDSVVDWKRLNLKTRDAVGDFLRSAGFRPETDVDKQRLRALQKAAVSYLKNAFDYEFPRELERPDRVSEIFIAAAASEGETQRLACATLKVMHIMHHLDSNELRHTLPIPDQDLFDHVEVRVDRAVAELRQAGFGVVRMIPSIKEKDSVVTKLLSKPRALAAQIYDRLRFRIITRDDSDIVPLLRHVCTRLFPFNYVVPEESRNDILDFRRFMQEEVAVQDYIDRLQPPLDQADRLHKGHDYNEFSGSDYRMVSFVADVPIRVDDALARWDPAFDRLGAIVYVMAEFQVFDLDTWDANERGASSHDAYKGRQRKRVRRRLIPFAGTDDLE